MDCRVLHYIWLNQAIAPSFYCPTLHRACHLCYNQALHCNYIAYPTITVVATSQGIVDRLKFMPWSHVASQCWQVPLVWILLDPCQCQSPPECAYFCLCNIMSHIFATTMDGSDLQAKSMLHMLQPMSIHGNDECLSPNEHHVTAFNQNFAPSVLMSMCALWCRIPLYPYTFASIPSSIQLHQAQIQ